ncbi:serine phosphatase RsbU (regulator of sigma subunit) [Streptomyces sp. 2333.5]|uniref:PP2C family protein-serine/threonine phosphatase n=1 Tax=Streptomyces TaxID=1883 RepID=UPI00089B4DC2|nr:MULTISPECIES: PP2C family protein-serine/threonine phosphatase [unclassified Streptomyces]PJJ02969.1 serine phosphatase RsbU (regulator of sigma subunit) [Streptomyces sp. 2333.5]SED65447.1 Serine phosphatase RsbU, regulator of sigma subunit [Streptomyces sp. 2314.4]SEE23859.1 Serine phosphatase RsbU, regulator of sigma subunit [Streptomyces sp. 2112.2]SOE12685.1 Serine phosphatase RsbU, regulator of sigma subunit [Streptomyces sp. 2323.1]
MAAGEQQAGKGAVDRSEGFGERLLGVLLDRAHEMPPQLIAPLIAEVVARVGGRNVSILLQDYAQLLLVPLPGRRLTVGRSELIGESHAGTAFLYGAPVEVPQDDGVRMYLPLLDGSDQVGVLALTLDTVDDDDRRLLRRLAGLVADMLVTKHSYTDQFFLARRREPMSLAAEIQWSLLPPLAMSVPQVAVAGILEPAYDVAGDSFDYALNEDILHVAMVDAMGHGLDAATMATVAIGAYRHARRAEVGLSEIYAFMDRAIAEQFGPDHFVTAQMMRLNITTGHLQWVNAGHPAPLLIRNGKVVRQLESPTTLPVGFGGEEPQISEQLLQRGDRVLCFTDGLIEEHEAGEEQFGEEQLIHWVDRIEHTEKGVRAVVRSLSHTLKQERGGSTSDDATLFLIEWRGGAADHLAVLE